MKSLFNAEVTQEIFNRVDALEESSSASWGKMNVEQMLKHCQKPLHVANGNLELNTKIGFVKKTIFKLFKPTMYNDKPWQKNIQTVREFKINEADKFAVEKDKLKEAINLFSKKKDNQEWPTHPFFGDFNTEQWGKMQYKHLDHHLKQFGV